MLYQLVVPGPIEDVEDVRVLEWHGAENHPFAVGDLMVELETHKAIVEIRANQPGILRVIVCEAGDWQKIGNPLAVLSDLLEDEIPDTLSTLPLLQAVFEIT